MMLIGVLQEDKFNSERRLIIVELSLWIPEQSSEWPYSCYFDQYDQEEEGESA